MIKQNMKDRLPSRLLIAALLTLGGVGLAQEPAAIATGTIADTMRDRLGGDHEVIQWRWEHSGPGRIEVVFSGEYTRADGVTLRFPNDLMGHLGIMAFWSHKKPELFHISRDRNEKKNLAAEFPERVHRLKQLHSKPVSVNRRSK
jgi:hypothetical protein